MAILTVNEIRDRSIPILKKYGLFNVYLFGSYARDEATEKSDVDLLFQSDQALSYLNIFKIENELEKVLGKSVDLVPLEQLSQAETPVGKYMFKHKIQQEKVVVA